MFNLIITVISIALIAALSLASIYYGGDNMSKGTARSNAATLVNQGQQLNGASALFRNDNGGTDVAAINDLVTGGYLASVPAAPANIGAVGWAIDSTHGLFTNEITSRAVCDEVQKQANGQAVQDVADLDTYTYGVYGCINDTTNSKLIAYYKR